MTPCFSFWVVRFFVLGVLVAAVTGHGLVAPEALCNCACFPLDDFVYCQNTARTTVGVSTFYFSPFTQRWEAKALRYFKENSSGLAAGRAHTSFLEQAVLPDGRWITNYKSQTINQNSATSGFEMCICYRIPAPNVPGVPTKTRLESSSCDKEV